MQMSTNTGLVSLPICVSVFGDRANITNIKVKIPVAVAGPSIPVKLGPKEPIKNIAFTNLQKNIGTNFRADSQLNAPYITSNPVALSWDNKASGAFVIGLFVTG